MSWIIFALISAISAALVAIFGKIGTEDLDSNLATAVRSVIMTIATVAFVIFRGSWHEIHSFSAKAWLFIVLSGISGAVSWLAYFWALKTGAASKVAPIDRLSVVFTLLLAWIVLGEKLSTAMVFGIVLMAAGSLLILKG